jgi:hypothetical protein
MVWSPDQLSCGLCYEWWLQKKQRVDELLAHTGRVWLCAVWQVVDCTLLMHSLFACSSRCRVLALYLQLAPSQLHLWSRFYTNLQDGEKSEKKSKRERSPAADAADGEKSTEKKKKKKKKDKEAADSE